MTTPDSTRAGGSEGASAPARLEDAPHVPLERAWRLWVMAGVGPTADLPRATADLETALDRTPTSELLALYTRGVMADAQDRYPTSWAHDHKPLAAEIDRRIPRRRA